MKDALTYRWVCPACKQGNAPGVAKCVKCNARGTAGAARVKEEQDGDPAGLQEVWPLHIRWIDGTAIAIVFVLLLIFEISEFQLRLSAGFLVAGVLAAVGEYAKRVEYRKRVRRYIAALEEAEELAIKRGQKPVADPELPGLLAGHKRPRLHGRPVLGLLTGMAAWILLFNAPWGYYTVAGVVCAGACALLTRPLWKK